jgi:hypothetical protein
MNEVETGQRRPGVWAKAFAECDGDDTRAMVAYLKARVQQLTDAALEQESQREIWLRQQALEASVLEKELPELVDRTLDGYVPIAGHEWHGIKVRELKNGIFAVETSRQQRCYKGINAAKDAVQEFVKHGRWTLKNLDFAVDRQLLANADRL